MDRKAAGGKGRWRLASGRQQPGKHVEEDHHRPRDQG
jgi:hypothetical protein